MTGENIYSAKTNFLYQDEYGDYGHACGLGSNEQQALQMCVGEIQKYEKSTDIDIADLVEINLLKEFNFYNKNTLVTLFISNNKDNNVIFWQDYKIELDKKIDVKNYILTNYKLLTNKNIPNFEKSNFVKSNPQLVFENHFNKIM